MPSWAHAEKVARARGRAKRLAANVREQLLKDGDPLAADVGALEAEIAQLKQEAHADPSLREDLQETGTALLREVQLQNTAL